MFIYGSFTPCGKKTIVKGIISLTQGDRSAGLKMIHEMDPYPNSPCSNSYILAYHLNTNESSSLCM